MERRPDGAWPLCQGQGPEKHAHCWLQTVQLRRPVGCPSLATVAPAPLIRAFWVWVHLIFQLGANAFAGLFLRTANRNQDTAAWMRRDSYPSRWEPYVSGLF